MYGWLIPTVAQIVRWAELDVDDNAFDSKFRHFHRSMGNAAVQAEVLQAVVLVGGFGAEAEWIQWAKWLRIRSP